jgi:hypothetical protein
MNECPDFKCKPGTGNKIIVLFFIILNYERISEKPKKQANGQNGQAARPLVARVQL